MRRVALLDQNRRHVIGNRVLVDSFEAGNPGAQLMVVPVSLAEMPGNVGGYLLHQALPRLNNEVDIAFARSQWQQVLLTAAALLMLSGVVAFLLARWFLVPVRALGEAARALAAGDYTARVAARSTGRRDEIGALASLTEECERLGRVVEDLYQLAMSDSGALNYRFVRVELAETVRRIADGMQAAFASAGLLADYLRHSAIRCECIGDGAAVDAVVRALRTDLILLDLMLPGKDGLTVCRELRRWTEVPIIMVTARVEDIDRLLGLELGADDYICKPFNPREVVARVRAVLRRTLGAAASAGSEPPAGLHFDNNRFEARLKGQLLTLTPVEFRLLRTFAQRAGHVLSRDRLLAAAYDDHRVVSDRTIDSHLRNLRRTLSDANGGVDLIRSAYGVGFRLE